MKIIAVLESSATAGGGFNQGLNAILQMKKICCAGNWEFEVFATHSESVDYLRILGVDARSFSFSILDKLLLRLSSSVWWHSLQNHLRKVGPFEKKLEARGCDLAYFVAPSLSPAMLQKLNYIATVWDLCHRDTPEFPEVRNVEFHLRERNLKEHLSPAVTVLTDSVQLANSIASRYGVDRARLLPMPFSPAPFLNHKDAAEKEAVLRRYCLREGYYFYPAQFWSHKNHIRILEALLILRGRGHCFRVVFSGGDQGSLGYVRAFAERHDLGSQVSFLGFVPIEDMRGLYEGCRAVVMPTYFGPTNVPPLEAWMLGKPLIYSIQFAEQANGAALLINPDDALELALAFETCADEEVCEALIAKGFTRLEEIDHFRGQSETELQGRIATFERRLSCWDQKG
jgi:glycosyltransferase involved in cell wall biosynthesis